MLFPCSYIASTVNSAIKSSHNNPPQTAVVEGQISVEGLWMLFHSLYTIMLPLIELQKVQLIKRLTLRTWELSENKKTTDGGQCSH